MIVDVLPTERFCVLTSAQDVVLGGGWLPEVVHDRM
jgi:hypothetical protein